MWSRPIPADREAGCRVQSRKGRLNLRWIEFRLPYGVCVVSNFYSEQHNLLSNFDPIPQTVFTITPGYGFAFNSGKAAGPCPPQRAVDWIDPCIGSMNGGKLALDRCDQGITNRGNVFQYAARKGYGWRPPVFARGTP